MKLRSYSFHSKSGGISQSQNDLGNSYPHRDGSRTAQNMKTNRLDFMY